MEGQGLLSPRSERPDFAMKELANRFLPATRKPSLKVRGHSAESINQYLGAVRAGEP